MLDCLFVYGTLHPERAPAAIRATARLLQPLGRASVEGTLFRLNGYPGLVLPGPRPRAVAGELFRIPDAEVLANLDEYEDFRPHNPRESLFLRVEALAKISDGSCVSCWIYTYNRPISETIFP